MIFLVQFERSTYEFFLKTTNCTRLSRLLVLIFFQIALEIV